MIRSMTGYGRSKYENETREYLIEIKSVNNRYNDINIKMPKTISYLEEKVRQQVLASFSRGKIDVFITFIDNSENGKGIRINTEIAKKYIEELKKLAQDTKIADDINVLEIVNLPEVLNVKIEPEGEDIIWNELKLCLQNAIESLIKMREVEGAKIKEDLEKRIGEISKKIEKINELSTGLVEEYVVKLEKRVNEILKTNVVDEARLAQEIVIYSDKCSVEEEITRLRSHVSQFLKLLESEKAIRKEIRLFGSRNE